MYVGLPNSTVMAGTTGGGVVSAWASEVMLNSKPISENFMRVDPYSE